MKCSIPMGFLLLSLSFSASAEAAGKLVPVVPPARGTAQFNKKHPPKAGSSTKYAGKLKLPRLAVPPVIGKGTSKMDSTSYLNYYVPFEHWIRDADTVSFAGELASQLKSFGRTNPAGRPAKSKPIIMAMNDCMDYLEQAARIKKAQLQAGDKKDSSGEVKSRLDAAYQIALNVDELRKRRDKK